MSRVSKWKLEKTKVKVVFRLQFQCTHIPQSGWNNLFISLVPADSGKATAKTNKANVRNGSCKWSDPIYETTRLLQDSKTKQFEEKIYKLLVAMGTSRSSLFGEASINLSEYVDALKPTAVSLPLQGSDSGAMLHVTVQLLTSKTGFREFEQQREVSDRGLPSNTDHDNGKLSASGDGVISRTDKVSPRVKFKLESKELPSLEEESGVSEEYADSTAGFDGSSNTSGSLCTEKNEVSSTREIESVKRTFSGDREGVPSPQSSEKEKGASDHRFLVHGTSDWVHQWGAENLTDGEIAIAYEENNRLRGALEAANMTINDLKREISSLQSYADDMGVEAQSLTKKLAIEISADQELVKEVSLLKSECSRFKDDLQWLKNLKMNPPIPRRTAVDADPYNLMQDTNLRWMKGISAVEDKIRDVQEKARLGFNGNDSTLQHTDLEALLSIVQDLKHGAEGSSNQLDGFSVGKAMTTIGVMSSPKTDHVMSDTGLGVELCHPEGVLLPGLLSTGTGSVDATNAMQGEIFKLLRELDESKAERECLLRKMDQMECYYEALIQELEENQKQILGELQNLRNEHSSCLYTVSSTKAQMEAMHQQMNNELLQLAEERCNLDLHNKELEKRAHSSEAALRRARLNYSIAVNKLQKDLEVLSLQVHSMYETNESLIRKAFSESPQSLLLECQDAVPNDLTRGCDSENFMISQSHSKIVNNQLLGSDRLLEELKRSLASQEELYGKIQEELFEMHLVNVYLDVFSVTLHEALVEADLGRRFAETEMYGLAKQLELSSRANESLRVQLQNMTGEVCNLSEEKNLCISRCNDLALENDRLEADLKTISNEKLVLDEKIGELGILLTDYRSYKRNYEECNVEKEKLAYSLEQATAEKGNLSDEILLLQEELMSMKSKVSTNEHLQSIVDYLRQRLNLLASGNERVDGLVSCRDIDDKNSEFEEFVCIIFQLEEGQRKLHDKILLLTKEKEDLLNECDTAKFSLASATSEVEIVKKKFECDIADMANKLNASSTLMEKLQTDLEVVGDKLKLNSEAEEKYSLMTHDLLSDFAKLEDAVQELTSKNRDLAAEILDLGSVTDEQEGDKLVIDRLSQENIHLTELLHNKTDELGILTLELNNLKGTVEILQDEISLQKGFRNQLEADVLNLNTQLKERDDMLSHLDQQKSEVSQLKRHLSDMESEKSSLYHQFSNMEEHLKKAAAGSSADLEIQLLDMHALVIASDIKCTVVKEQYKYHVEALLQQLKYSNQLLLEVNKQNLDLTSKLNNCLASKETFAEENTRLLSALENFRSESESYVFLNKDLENTNTVTLAELEEYKKKSDHLETRYEDAKLGHRFNVEELKSLLGSSQIENDSLIISKEELEIRFLVMKALVEEMSAHCKFHEEYREELTVLQKQCSDLTRKLSEQILKTEEFKNLSIHLKELKDKAEAGHLQAREKKDAEGPSASMQESLRIAFIKEQYETKIQEVRHQLSISKKHGEEMLWKLQDALDELENRKKCEASQLKRNEELLLKITELEDELQSVLSDNRERFMEYEQLKAELDCSVMSLDCCMEEKKQLMSSLQESNDEKTRLADEIELLREQIENLKAFMISTKTNEDGCNALQKGSNFEKIVDDSSDDQANYLSHNMSRNIERGDRKCMNLPAEQDALVTKSSEGLSGVIKDQDDINLHDDQLKAQNLMSSMDRLQKELERMRSENTLLEDEKSVEQYHEGLRSEQMHLEKVTQELSDMSSLYNDSSRSGNSVERVLALELELAEALQAKKKSTIQFQSSFLKLHSDEAAVFHSFRDINELIKDLLEMKDRYSAMEAELKDMHERYSQLSLDFAEVEGERQKLTMTLKNVRSPKKLLNRLQSSTYEDPSS
ncbi:GRIP and coiled-coil domain-containing protein 2-like [Chenopodium quinoa]|nr:GRIP and coiled-coil domain-containing protein 2-like [Chenopodium quinoa]XP_021714840.1 GRIP and coiled-coil domain-containing protein 2-like [Chenopodium quinoa]XP_021714841.1 GRIP and coiled-coil domain-containing protein 2-like [Chenopodium quinoa]XP_021714842.1 GRIP and coiled-coil domain-containing protein 2-like [Chenopodium quinoa]XP_021714843.1 GRIP and coiled-coil domain-containing protein 2-like [Chenopodium quinoa]